MSRLFVAIWPSAAVADQIESALAPLRRKYSQLRWQPASRWHITLAFLGERDDEAERARFEALPTAPSGPLHLRGAGSFGPILWLGFEPSDWLAELAHQVQHNHHVHERRFRPHVTVGRSRSTQGRRELHAAQHTLAGFGPFAWTPDEYTLVRSTTGPQPEYEVIARSRLRIAP